MSGFSPGLWWDALREPAGWSTNAVVARALPIPRAGEVLDTPPVRHDCGHLDDGWVTHPFTGERRCRACATATPWQIDTH